MSNENTQNTTPSTPASNTASSANASKTYQGGGQNRSENRGTNGENRSGNTQGGGQNARGGNRTFARKKPFDRARNNTRDGKGGASKGKFGGGAGRDKRRPQREETDNITSKTLLVNRVTKVVKGGKRMRFAALVVAGDKEGRVGYGFKKGMDYQDAVAKALKKAKDSLIKIQITEEGSIKFPIQMKFKSSEIYLKPARSGTGLIAGSFIRTVLELVGVQNIYSKNIGSSNKVAGVQNMMEILKKYEVNN
jgi:small subunit ribosomal protein S5